MAAARKMETRSITELLGDKRYCKALTMMRANLPLIYPSRDDGGLIVEQTKQVGLRWIENGVARDTPPVVRLIVDNCGLKNEFPVSQILQAPGGELLRTMEEVNDTVYDIIRFVRRGSALTAEILGDTLAVHYTAERGAGGRHNLTMYVQRPANDRRPWKAILNETPTISGARHRRTERSKILRRMRARAAP